jgi:mRNA-degrading endonuclease RelE of RelBE toxin-antitoxin system
MIIEFDKSFDGSLEKARNKSLFRKIEKVIIAFENAKSFTDLPNIKKLSYYKYYYRVRIGEYRLDSKKFLKTHCGL